MGRRVFLGLLMVLTVFTTICAKAQNPATWTASQLMEPSDLANKINGGKDVPVIVSVGPGATIPHSIEIGLVNNPEGLNQLKTALKAIPKGKKIVVYCGCCPFEHCPNVRPALATLKEMKFTNYYLLNLPHNIKRDWIDKGFPVQKN